MVECWCKPIDLFRTYQRLAVQRCGSSFLDSFRHFSSLPLNRRLAFLDLRLCIPSLEHAVSDDGDDEPRLFMSGFFQELQRRKVYRVAAAYIIAAGFIIQIGSAVFPAWELPNWTLRFVIVLLLAGFPVALILAWAYDVTPQGIQATPKVPGGHRRRILKQCLDLRRHRSGCAFGRLEGCSAWA